MNNTSPIMIRCREITEIDLEAIAQLLQKGFPKRSLRFWLTNLKLLASIPQPTGCPQYGYLLERDSTPVGAVLTVSSRRCTDNNVSLTQCNLSSWYVEPAYRSYAALLAAKVWREKDFTYLNIDPAVHTRPIIEAQGFRCYSRGQFLAIPSLSLGGEAGATVTRVGTEFLAQCDSRDRDLLLAHEKYGCVTLYGIGSNFSSPFVFRRRLLKGVIPCAQVVYCRTIDDIARFARPLGRFLASRGELFILIDSNGPISGLPGFYLNNYMPKYFKGPIAPRLGDLAYTEVAMFGV